MNTRTTRINSADILGDLDAPAGTKPWAIGMKNRLQELLDERSSNHMHLELCVESFIHYEGWKQIFDPSGLAFRNYTDFCITHRPFGLGRHPEEIEQIIRERKAKTAQEMAADPDVEAQPTLSEAMKGNKNASKTQRMAQDPNLPPLPPAGQNSHDNVSPVLPKAEYGNRAEYLIRRLKRDAPKIADALANGEYKSARAAGIAAGIVKVPSPLELVQKAWAKANEREREEIRAWMGSQE